MKKIPSFTVDHLRLNPGVYVSRKDTTASGDGLTTFDIRFTAPNREEAVMPEALHSIEHLAATWLRNHPVWADRTVYWGPMGCCTGSYLIVKGDVQPLDIIPALAEMFEWISGFEGEIPGANASDCGNYTFNNLAEARKVAKRFLNEVLLHPDEKNTVYPA